MQSSSSADRESRSSWRLPYSLMRRVKQLALDRETTMTAIIVAALERELDEQENAREQDVRSFVGGGR